MSSDQAPPVELLRLDMDQLMDFFLSITSTKAAQYLGVPMIEGEDGAKKTLDAFRL